MISFYSLPSSVINNPKHKTLNAAYMFYYAVDIPEEIKDNEEEEQKFLKKRLTELAKDAMMYARKVKHTCGREWNMVWKLICHGYRPTLMCLMHLIWWRTRNLFKISSLVLVMVFSTFTCTIGKCLMCQRTRSVWSCCNLYTCISLYIHTQHLHLPPTVHILPSHVFVSYRPASTYVEVIAESLNKKYIVIGYVTLNVLSCYSTIYITQTILSINDCHIGP